MKILIISPRFPYKYGKADSMTVFHMIEYFHSRKHQVILATFDNNEQFPEEERAYLKSICVEHRVIKLEKWKKRARLALNFLDDKPFQVAYYKKREMQDAINELINLHQPDLIYAHLIRVSEYLNHIGDIPKILAMQIAQTLNYQRLIKHERQWYRKQFYSLEHQRVIKYEANIIDKFDRILLISPHDKKAIDPNNLYHNVFFNPHGIDVAFFSEKLELTRKSNVIAMNGDFGVPTNIDGALYFYQEIFPIIREVMPETELWLVGRNPDPLIKALEKDSYVTVTGRVPDIRPYLHQATVGVAPMRVAAGLQNKILVSLASSLPMVVTPISNEGISAPENHVLLEGKNKDDFAQKVIRLLKEENERKYLATNALEFMKRYWTWEFHFEKLEEMMFELVENPTSKVINYYPLKNTLINK